jgi:hypothetical protein
LAKAVPTKSKSAGIMRRKKVRVVMRPGTAGTEEALPPLAPVSSGSFRQHLDVKYKGRAMNMATNITHVVVKGFSGGARGWAVGAWVRGCVGACVREGGR